MSIEIYRNKNMSFLLLIKNAFIKHRSRLGNSMSNHLKKDIWECGHKLGLFNRNGWLRMI